MIECTHPRQDKIADTEEWVCKDCGALMDPEDPTFVLASDQTTGP